MNTVREIQRINEQELERGIAGTSASWHAQYAKSAWVFVGNLEVDLTEGDLIAVLSQFGEIEDLHLVREEDTGKSRGFSFCKYEDARSCVLAVDNFCGIQLCGRTIRVDHVENYRLPKNLQEQEENAATAADLTGAGQAYKGQEMANKYSLHEGQDLFAPLPKSSDDEESSKDDDDDDKAKKEAKRQRKEERKRKRAKKEKRRRDKGKRKMEKEGRKREKKRSHRTDRPESSDDEEDRRRHHSSKKRRYDSDEASS